MENVAPFFETLYRGRSFTPDEDAFSGDQHISSRLSPLKRDASGFETVMATNSRYLLSVRSITPHTNFEDCSTGLGRLIFAFHLEGRRDTFINDIPALKMCEPCLGIYYHPVDAKMRSCWYAGSNEKSVIIGSWLKDLPEGFLDAMMTLPQFHNLPNADSADFNEVIALQLPFNPRLKKCVMEILEIRMERGFIPYYLESKTLEALCLSIDLLLTSLRSAESTVRHNRALVHDIIEKIEDSLSEVSDVQAVAREAGMPVRDFSRVFKEVTGENYGEFVARRRVERAIRLIETTRLPLKIIAHQVGYKYTSNLSLAVSKAFGRSPRDIRRAQISAPGRTVKLLSPDH